MRSTNLVLTGLRSLLMASLLICVGGAWALELDDAKQQGLVGEEWNGFIGAVGEASPDVASLVRDVNARRLAEYERIAQQNNLSVREVGEVAGRRLIERTPPGGYVRLPDQGWVQR
jgi:uncharacterized protein